MDCYRVVRSEIVPTEPPNKTKRKEFVEIFRRCFYEIGKVNKHTCTKSNASESIIDLARNLPEKQREQAISSMLKGKAQKGGHQGTLDFHLKIST